MVLACTMHPCFQIGVAALTFAFVLACTPEPGPVADDEGSGSLTDTSTSAPGTESGETDESGETGTEGETGEPICYDVLGTWDIDTPNPLSCMLEPLCPDVVFPYEAFECGSPDYDAVAAACVIDALRAGTPGAHRLRDCGGAKYNVETRLQVFDDGTVLYYRQNNTCATPSSWRETWRILPDPAYFDACDITTGAGFGQCIEGIVDQPCVFDEPSCP
jgi:hypothetical protein